MKNLKSFTLTLAILSLFVGTACEQLEEVIPQDVKEENLSYQGFTHNALGDAELVTEGSGNTQTLNVKNLGSSGQDGVRINLGTSSGLDMYYEPVEIPNGGSLEYYAYAANASEAQSGMRILGDQRDRKLEVFFDEQKSVRLEGYRDGELVLTKEDFTGSRWIWIPIAWYVLDHVSGHYTQHSDGSSEWGVDWGGTAPNGNGNGNYPDAELVIDKESFKVDYLRIISGPKAAGSPQADNIRILGKNLPSLTIIDEEARR